MKRLLKDKRGMSLMELLVAFSLLMILIVGTTPVMLSAYSGLYTAGEFTQETYDAKTEIENQLATRSSVLELQNFAVNYNNLGAVAQVNVKRAVSTLVDGLETVFTGGRAHITIISGNTVNDDAKSHELVVQVSNYKLNGFYEICDLQEYASQPDPSKIRLAFDVITPKKSTTAKTDEAVYYIADGEVGRNPKVTVVQEKSNLDMGRITIRIDGEGYFDFTKSPLKIQIWYYDEDGELLTAADYLHIKTPTIIAAGKTSTSEAYYTTAGVVTTENKTTNAKTTTFNIEGRELKIGTYRSTQAVPANTVFKSVNWVTETVPNEDETGTTSAQATNPFETSYYVLTGTNGVIYRTYSQAKVGSIAGRVSIYAADGDSAFGLNNLKLNSYTGRQQAGLEDVMGTVESDFTTKTGTVVYPAGWSGDFSHIFGYSAYGREYGYTSSSNSTQTNNAWYTQSSFSTVVTTNTSARVAGKGSDGFFSNLACYGYYYNGYALNTPYHTMNAKKLSYILTEVPYSMRVGSYLADVSNTDKNWEFKKAYDGEHYDRIWERPVTAQYTAAKELTNLSYLHDDWSAAAYFGANDNSGMPRSVIVKEELDDSKFQNEHQHYLPTYFVEEDNTYDRPDNGFAQIRLKALTTLSPTTVYSRGGRTDSDSDMRVAYDWDDNYSKITVTDSVYIPGTGMFYIGTVAAYAMVNQVDNTGMTDGSDKADVRENRNTPTKNTGRLTSYWIESNADGTQTTIYKHSTKSEYITSRDKKVDLPHGDIRNRLMNSRPIYNNTSNDYSKNSSDLTNAVKANTVNAAQFFISQPLEDNGDSYNEKVYGRIFSDVAFTMGYTSNREMVYNNIVYGRDESGKLIQSLKFCEPFYFLSHYDDENHTPNLYMNSKITNYSTSHTTTYNGKSVNTFNSEHNDYYNVWFPGEMYNLTKVATKDGVTVAVGYAVAGSTYTYLNTKDNGSTGLGGVFNDGVLAGMVLGEGDAFENLLYYKDNKSFDATSLSSGNVKFEQHGTSGQSGSWKSYADFGWSNYGTHARNSVQFVAVDLSVENVKVSDSSSSEEYYAYYADNWGRVFRSLVATKDSSGDVELVEYIADQAYNSTRTAESFMEEQKVGDDSIGEYFEKITSIKVSGDLIFVTGHPKAGSSFYVVVGKISSAEDTAPTWTAIQIDELTNSNKANDMLVLNDYLYIVGNNGSAGWISATPISSIKNCVTEEDDETEGTEETGSSNTDSSETTLVTLVRTVNNALYAIDGHS